MSTFTLRLPSSLHRGVKQLAEREGVSMNQIIATAVAEKLSALMTEDYLAERAARGSRDFLHGLALVLLTLSLRGRPGSGPAFGIAPRPRARLRAGRRRRCRTSPPGRTAW
jgi:predicted transcriptional regulator